MLEELERSAKISKHVQILQWIGKLQVNTRDMKSLYTDGMTNKPVKTELRRSSVLREMLCKKQM